MTWTGDGRAAHPRDRELLRLQRTTDLLRLALAYGYRPLDGKIGSADPLAGTFWLRHPATQDVIVLTRHRTGWSFSSHHDPLDRGSAVDFLLRRRRLGIGHVRKELRYWAAK